jgi:arylsulfatase A-like enzyme
MKDKYDMFKLIRTPSRTLLRLSFGIILLLLTSVTQLIFARDSQPNIVLVMADDMGWGQTGYYDHPVLETPNLDAMAANGLRFDRFYAGAPVCSPTRASVLTGRSNDRTGVLSHGYPLRRQEMTLARALRDAGYATGHFGKWHLNGLRGPGVPILESDTHHPGVFGFDQWMSVTNFFDLNPLMSRQGEFVEFEGDSSEIIVAESLTFIEEQVKQDKPFLSVIWYGSPHSPFVAEEEDRATFRELDEASQHHYGELVAMDRSIGTLRQGLRDLEIAENTIVWFCSDNGGLTGITPGTVSGLRGSKGTVYEGGLRVPAVIEWPDAISEPRITEFPAGTVDIFPTLAEIIGLPNSILLQPCDGMSLSPLLTDEIGPRTSPLPFRHNNRAAWIDNDYKLVTQDIDSGEYELYDLVQDPTEENDLFESKPEIANRLQDAFTAWNATVVDSIAGADYPGGELLPGEPESRFWMTSPEYQEYLDAWKDRPEYEKRIGK